MLPSTLFQRLVAFGGPYLSIATGYLATLLVTHVTFLGNLGIDKKTVAADLTKLGVFAVGTAVTWAGHQKWLSNLEKLWNSLAIDPSSSLILELEKASGTAPAELPLPAPAPMPVFAPAPVVDPDPASTVAATITPAEEAAVQPPADVVIPESAVVPDGPAPLAPDPTQPQS